MNIWNGGSKGGGGGDYSLLVPNSKMDHDTEFAKRMSIREIRKPGNSICDEKECKKSFFCIDKEGNALCQSCARKNKWAPCDFGSVVSSVWDYQDTQETILSKKFEKEDVLLPKDADTTLMGQTYHVLSVEFDEKDLVRGFVVQLELDIGFDLILKPKVVLHNLCKPNGIYALRAFFYKFQYTKGSFQIICRNTDNLYEGLLYMDGIDINNTLVDVDLAQFKT